MQRILEVIASIPNLIVVILFVLILNHPFGQLYWLCHHRLVRHEQSCTWRIFKIENQEFVMASKTLGLQNSN